MRNFAFYAASAVVVSLLAGAPAGAEQTKSQLPATSAANVLKDSRAYLNSLVHLRGAACVDPGGAGFVCVINGSEIIQIRGSALGPDTPIDIAEDLIGPCKGTANLTSDKCRFDIEVTPMSARKSMVELGAGTRQVLVLESHMVDMYRPRR